MEITIPYQPRTQQLAVHNHKARFKVCVFHRQAGKTTLAVNEIIKQAIKNPKELCLYIAPTYRMAKDIVWKPSDMLFYYLPQELIAKKNEVEMSITLKNGSLLMFKGADDPDSLRGIRPRFVVLDEYGDMKEDVWTSVLRPVMASQERAKALFIGTPKGRNHFFDIFNKGQDTGYSKIWKSWLLKASDSGVISKEALEDAKKEMTEAAYNQEFECDFLEDAAAVFKDVDSKVWKEEPFISKNRNYKLGVDLAKHQDWTVITAIDLHNHKVFKPERFNKIDWTLQKTKIEAEYHKHNQGVITLDSSGIGDPIFDDLNNQGMSIQDYKFTEQSRKALLENLIILLEQCKIGLPPYEPLLTELKSFRYELNPTTRKIKMQVPEGINDDCVMSLALACWELRDPLPEPSEAIGNTFTWESGFETFDDGIIKT